MKYAVSLLAAVCLGFAALSLAAQGARDIVLPNGKPWREEINRADYERNLKDARELAKVAAEIEADLEAVDQNVLPLKTLKKVERAEELAKNLRGRLRKN